MKRQFSVQALNDCSVLGLKIDYLEKIQKVFPDIHAEIFMNAMIRYKTANKLKNQTVAKIQSLILSSEKEGALVENKKKGFSILGQKSSTKTKT